MRILGVVLVVVGLVALIAGGLSWTREDKILDAGPIEISADKREGIAIPPVAGGLILAAGVLLLVVKRQRVA